MIKSLFSILILSCIHTLGSASNTDNKVELRKTVSREFAINKNEGVEVSNRYGKVTVNTWDKNAVKVDVTIIAKSDSKAKAQEKIDQISIAITKGASGVSAVTSIEENSNFGWFNTDKVNFQINYQVYMPSQNALIIENKYGDIALPEMNNKVSINLKYGALEGCSVNGPLMIDLAYSKAIMGNTGDMNGEFSYSNYVGTNTKNLNLNVRYSKVIMDNSNSTIIDSRYSNYKMGNISSLTMTGKYDELYAGTVRNANITFAYTDVKFVSLVESLTAELDYGSLVLQDVANNFKSIGINGEYTPIRIQTKASSHVEVNGSYTDTNFGADFVTKSKSKEGSKSHVKGHKGSGKTASSIVIDSRYGDVSIY